MAGRPLKRARDRERARTDTLTGVLGEVLEEALAATRAAILNKDAMGAKNFASAVAILADRYHLRSGLPTSATVHLTPDLIAAELAEALKNEIPDAALRKRVALRVLRGEGSSAPGPEGLEPPSPNGAKAPSG